MASRRRKKISTLGTLAIALGAVAWFAARTPVLGEGPIVIGTCGAVLGLLAMLGSSLIGNTGKFIPVLGLLTCGSAMAFGVTHNTTGVGPVDQLKQFVDRFRPVPAPAPVITPASTARSSPAATRAAEDQSVGRGTIFDMTSAGKGSLSPSGPPEEKPKPAVAPPTIAPTTPALPAPNATQRFTAAMNAVTRAQAKVDAAMAALIPALSKTDVYRSARSELDAAGEALATARTNGEPGNPELVAAAQRYVNAKTALQKLINAAATTDPQATAAKQELIAAQGELRAAKEDLANSKTRKN